MSTPLIVASRELMLPGRPQPVKVSLGLKVEIVPIANRGLTLSISLARRLDSLLQQVDIGDALWSFGIKTGIHAAIEDETGSAALDDAEIRVDVRTLRISVAVQTLTPLELAQVGSLIRDMAREILRNIIAQESETAPTKTSQRIPPSRKASR